MGCKLKQLVSYIFIFSLLLAVPVYSQDLLFDSLPTQEEGEVIVIYQNDGVSGASDTEELTVVKLNKDESVEDGVERISKDPNVKHVQPNFIYYTAAESNDPLITDGGFWWAKDIGLDKYDEIYPTTTNEPILAVIDTNTKTSHPELRNKLWSSDTCFDGKNNEIGPPLKCNTGGFSYIRGELTDDPEFGYSFHGTSVSGLALGEFGNGKGTYGVARNTKLMALNSNISIFPHRAGTISTARAATLINLANNNSADVINLSFGRFFESNSSCPLSARSYDRILYNAIKNFDGIVFSAAGNNGRETGSINSFYTPAGYSNELSDSQGRTCWEAIPNLVSVGGSFMEDTRQIYTGTENKRTNLYASTNKGDHIDIFAPGEGILTTSVKSSLSSGAAELGDWSSGILENRDKLNRDKFISPINGSDLRQPSSHLIGPVDISFLDSSIGQTVSIPFVVNCINPDALNSIKLSSSGDGLRYRNIPQNRIGIFRNVDDDGNARNIPDFVYIKLDWAGTNANLSGVTRSNCHVKRDFVYFTGPLRDDLTSDEEIQLGYYSTVKGTSFATPIAAGLASVLLEIKSDLTPEEIKDIIVSSADPRVDGDFNYKKLDFYRAVTELKRRYPDSFGLSSAFTPAPLLSTDKDNGRDKTDNLTNIARISFEGTADRGSLVSIIAEKDGYSVTSAQRSRNKEYLIDINLERATDEINRIPYHSVNGVWDVYAEVNGVRSLPTQVTIDMSPPRITKVELDNNHVVKIYFNKNIYSYLGEIDFLFGSRRGLVKRSFSVNFLEDENVIEYPSINLREFEILTLASVTLTSGTFEDNAGNSLSSATNPTDVYNHFLNNNDFDFSGDGVANTTDSILFYAYAIFTANGFSQSNIENLLETVLEKELDYSSSELPRLSDSKEDVYALLDNYAKTNATDFSGDGVTNTTDSILFYAYAIFTAIGESERLISSLFQQLLSSEGVKIIVL